MPVWFITVSQYTAQCLVYDRIPKKYLLNAWAHISWSLSGARE
jgi:hypothetical protein